MNLPLESRCVLMLVEDAAVVVEGQLTSSRKPADLPDFCRAILEFMAG